MQSAKKPEKVFDSRQRFVPLLPPGHLLGSCLERASAIANQAAELGGGWRIQARAALHDKYSDRPEIAQLQRIAVAYIEAEKEVETQAANVSPLNAEFIKIAHRSRCGRLVLVDRRTKVGRPRRGQRRAGLLQGL
ncbi:MULTISPECIES: hypothetical protein [Achromobacter]|uniref:Uncharacterized protein n=1 Tax=Achromobacter denitrificans TaxID=32002 RepID=A0A6N0JKV0_ACHDE|nr:MULTISPECIES: hypothetical protein [Achromobacter]QKQ47683.1 hypothetical protein FOC81_13690 [Achromobacter denitrificans]